MRNHRKTYTLDGHGPKLKLSIVAVRIVVPLTYGKSCKMCFASFCLFAAQQMVQVKFNCCFAIQRIYASKTFPVRSFVRSFVVHRLNGSKPLGTDSHNCSAHFARSPQIHQIPGLCIFYGGVHTQHMSAKWGELLTDPQIINFCRTLFMPPFGKHIGTPTTYRGD